MRIHIRHQYNLPGVQENLQVHGVDKLTPDTSTPDELRLRGKVVAYTDIIPGIPRHYVVVFTDQTVLSFPEAMTKICAEDPMDYEIDPPVVTQGSGLTGPTGLKCSDCMKATYGKTCDRAECKRRRSVKP